jgi:hypothetical protein
MARVLGEGGDGGNGPWFVCVFVCVCGEATKNKVGPKKGDGLLELIARGWQ